MTGRGRETSNDYRLSQDLCLSYRDCLSLIARGLHINIAKPDIRIWIHPLANQYKVLLHAGLRNYTSDQRLIPTITDHIPANIQSLRNQLLTNINSSINSFWIGEPSNGTKTYGLIRLSLSPLKRPQKRVIKRHFRLLSHELLRKDILHQHQLVLQRRELREKAFGNRFRNRDNTIKGSPHRQFNTGIHINKRIIRMNPCPFLPCFHLITHDIVWREKTNS